MTPALRVLLLAAAAALLLSALLTLAPGFGAPGAWRLAGPDAPDLPLPDLLPLWIAAALALGAAAITASSDATAWAAVSGRRISLAAFLAAAYLLVQDVAGIAEAGLIGSIIATLFAARAAAWHNVVQVNPGDRAYTFAGIAVSFIASSATLSNAALMPAALRTSAGLGPTDTPWFFFWIGYSIAAVQAWGFLRRVRQRRWYLLALGWGVAASIWHNWAVAGLHFIAILTALLSLFLLARVTRPRKQPKPQA